MATTRFAMRSERLTSRHDRDRCNAGLSKLEHNATTDAHQLRLLVSSHRHHWAQRPKLASSHRISSSSSPPPFSAVHPVTAPNKTPRTRSTRLSARPFASRLHECRPKRRAFHTFLPFPPPTKTPKEKASRLEDKQQPVPPPFSHLPVKIRRHNRLICSQLWGND